MEGRNWATLVIASTEPTSTARWMGRIRSNSTANSASFFRRTGAWTSTSAVFSAARGTGSRAQGGDPSLGGSAPAQGQPCGCCAASESIATRAKPADDQHLEDFVAEHIWHLLTLDNALTFVIPLRIEGLDWSLTDSGGYGLAVYRPDGAPVFRFWESKAHTGGSAVRDVAIWRLPTGEQQGVALPRAGSKVVKASANWRSTTFNGV
jgi:hypothetical protein